MQRGWKGGVASRAGRRSGPPKAGGGGERGFDRLRTKGGGLICPIYHDPSAAASRRRCGLCGVILAVQPGHLPKGAGHHLGGSEEEEEETGDLEGKRATQPGLLLLSPQMSWAASQRQEEEEPETGGQAEAEEKEVVLSLLSGEPDASRPLPPADWGRLACSAPGPKSARSPVACLLAEGFSPADASAPPAPSNPSSSNQPTSGSFGGPAPAAPGARASTPWRRSGVQLQRPCKRSLQTALHLALQASAFPLLFPVVAAALDCWRWERRRKGSVPPLHVGRNGKDSAGTVGRERLPPPLATSGTARG